MYNKFLVVIIAIFITNGCGGGGSGSEQNNTNIDNNITGDNNSTEVNSTITTTEANALTYLNQKRVESNLNTLSSNSKLHTAAKAHTLYMYSNNLVGHYEDSSKKSYYAYAPRDRAIKAGYSLQLIAEGISYDQDSYKLSIESLLTAIYHRFTLLNPYVDEAGIGIKNLYYTYDLATKNSPTFHSSNNYVVYPPNNSNSARAVFVNYEKPSPINEKFSGNPVSIEFNKDAFNCNNISKNSFTLKDLNTSTNINILSDGNIDGSNDSHLSYCQFAIFPENRLKLGHKYKATFNYNYNSQNHIIKWTFTIPKPNGEIITLNDGDNVSKNNVALNTKYYIYCKPNNSNPEIKKVQYSYSTSLEYTLTEYDPNIYILQITSANSNNHITLNFNNNSYQITFNVP